MVAATLLADLTLVVAVSTFEMLIFYLIANIAAFRIPIKYWQYPAFGPVIGAVSCIVLIGFLTINSWIIGIIGRGAGIAWYAVQRRINR
jgi:APA family basic amino acid/polyamine antiporter